MSALPALNSKEIASKNKRTDLLTNKVQPNFAKELNKMGVSVEPVLTQPTTLDSYFIVRLPVDGKANDVLLTETKRKIFSSGRFLLNAITAYSFKVSIALSNVEDGFSFTPLSIDSNYVLPEASEVVEPEVKQNPIQTLKTQPTMKNEDQLKEKVRNFLQSCKFKSGIHYTNIVSTESKGVPKEVVNCKSKKFAEELFNNRLSFGEEGLVFMKPGTKSVRFFERVPIAKLKSKATPQAKKEPSKKVLQKKSGFKGLQEAFDYISKHLSEANSGSAEKIWENIQKKHGPDFELLVRVRSKRAEKLIPISKEDFESFA
jgi:hypothetical protein